ncbi:sensor histidine kinase [Actinocatenispora rupis]|uniref:histidine kinase n=1 Tax=Actinocatenispora rupis TaxID=519421 RepID=A0A8J3J1M8_9ACTN|nr:sensor histidine kinase [Actinocatenispora rupis]GID09841.1 two-component sensor histidine kinase [Actinocatenispora rupis]
MSLVRHRAVLGDAALGVGVAVVVAVAIAMDLGGERRPDPVAYLFAAGLGALMLVRRRFPVLALVATGTGILGYYAAGYPAVGLALPVAGALYSAAEAGRYLPAALTAVALVAVSTGFRLAQGESAAYLLGFELASTVGLMLAAIALGAAVRATRLLRAEQVRAARRAAAERDAEAARRVAQERLRIARDLHDVLGHTVAVITVQANVADEALDDDPSATRAALATIRSVGDTAVRELRDTLGVLRDGADRAPTGSLTHLDALADATGLTVSVRTEGEPVPLPTVVDATAYRIVQEALTNALKHGHATHADVLLRYGPDRLHLTVTDRGANPVHEVPDGGTGIAGMRERAALLGGTVTAEPLPDNGFRVTATLPVAVGR